MNLAVRRIAISAAFILLGVYSYFTLSGPQGIAALLEKRRLIRTYEEDNANIIRENEIMRDRVRRLRESSSQQDLVIREKLKKTKEDDTEFILPDDEKSDAAPAPDSAPKP